jgi:hypothetical protein
MGAEKKNAPLLVSGILLARDNAKLSVLSCSGAVLTSENMKNGTTVLVFQVFIVSSCTQGKNYQF